MMKNTITDDKSFQSFLESLSWEDLMDHASNHFSPEIINEILLEQEANYEDYLLNLKGIETDSQSQDLKLSVQKALSAADEETLTDLMINFTPEETVISYLIKTSDEDTRLDIISNQKN